MKQAQAVAYSKRAMISAAFDAGELKAEVHWRSRSKPCGGGACLTYQTILVCGVAYLLNLFTTETWSAIRGHGATVSGFRARQLTAARDRVKPGDILLCYLVRLSRWCGALEVKSRAFTDSTPIFSDRTRSLSGLT